MSRISVDADYTALRAAIDALEASLRQTIYLKGSRYTTGIEAILNDYKYDFVDGSDIDVTANYYLDMLAEIKEYYETGKNIPGGAATPGIDQQPDFTIGPDTINKYIVFIGTQVTIPVSTNYDAPLWTEVHIEQHTANQTEIIAEPGVTLNSINSIRTISDRYGVVTIKKVAQPDTWTLFGALG